MKEISFLLGAGFSVNKGYPTAGELNNKLTTYKAEQFCISTGGEFGFLDDGQEDPFWYSDYHKYKLFTIEFIEFYSKMKKFHYEEFYDYYQDLYKGVNEDPAFNEFCDTFREKYHCTTDNHNLLSQHHNIFNQLIPVFLVDAAGRKYYPPEHCGKPIYPGYTGFLDCIENFGKDSLIHIHTLNHDLLFEVFNDTDWLSGELSDGFKELGSPYYGEYQGRFKIRLRYFADEYNTKYIV
jgi:hypothetical protein